LATQDIADEDADGKDLSWSGPVFLENTDLRVGTFLALDDFLQM